MPPIQDLITATVIGDLSDIVSPFFRPCRPKVLVVTDGSLGYSAAAGFGLTRFLEALAGASPAPILTLAHRAAPPPASVTIGATTYNIVQNFRFDTATPAVTKANYDQIWMFGFNTGPMPVVEVKVVADFMNAGGGVFATGDHATLGRSMSGQLPRIRHMREWAAIPMGTEGNPTARNRIDTVIDPGANALYEFNDQADAIPQRIYPNYEVAFSGGAWSATLHPLLRMPGSVGTRTDATGFTNDMDVMPDHPHESICLEVSPTANPAALNGNYTVTAPSFQEFPNAVSGVGRVGSQIIAFAVSGGRSVFNGVWKPPVNPRMFGIMSAFDGHQAAPYAGAATRPGRAVCDSTWHHFVNVNLDGTSSGRTGLGTGSGAGFVPSAALQKIFTYYRNILGWLQPLNRRSCRLLIDVVGLRFNQALVEELAFADTFKQPNDFEGVGVEVIRVLEEARGRGAAVELVQAALRDTGVAAGLAEPPSDGGPSLLDTEGDRLVAYALGRTLAELALVLPADSPDRLHLFLREQGHDKLERRLKESVARYVVEATEIEAKRIETRLCGLQRYSKAASQPVLTATPTRPVKPAKPAKPTIPVNRVR